MTRLFYRIFAAIVCIAVVSAAIHWRLISANLGIGLIEGSIVFIVCQSIGNINLGALVFYGIWLIQIFVMRSVWAAVGYFFSPFLVFGTYGLTLSIAQPKWKSDDG